MTPEPNILAGHVASLMHTFVKFTADGWAIPEWLFVLAEQWGVSMDDLNADSFYVCEFPPVWEATQ